MFKIWSTVKSDITEQLTDLSKETATITEDNFEVVKIDTNETYDDINTEGLC